MRTQLKVTFIFFIGAGVAISLYLVRPEVPSGSERTIASLEDKKITYEKRASGEQEVPGVAYQFDRRIKATLKSKGVSKSLMDLQFSGLVKVYELEKTDKQSLLSLHFELKPQGAKAVIQSHIPFLISLTADGKILMVRTLRSLSAEEEDQVNILKDFASLFAYQNNQDTTGKYTFTLTRDHASFKKVKTAYEKTPVQHLHIIHSKQEGEIEEKHSWLAWAKGEESLKADAGSENSVVTESSYRIERLQDPLGIGTRIADQSDRETFETSLEINTKSAFAPVPWEKLKIELERIRKLSKSEKMSLFHEIRKLLITEPDKVKAFKEAVEKEPDDGGAMTFGIGVLASAGNDESQAALRAWFEDHAIKNGKSDIGHTILNSLATTDAQLNDETRKFLRDQVESKTDPDLAENAAFALGSSLRKTNDSETRDALVKLFENSKTELERVSALDAIGNSGDARFLPLLMKVIASGTSREREKAVYAVRFIHDPQTQSIYLNAFRDQDHAVRSAAIRGILLQDQLAPFAQVLKECAAQGNVQCKGALRRVGI